ncbi:MAG: DUF5686 family protein [Bacteroidota bacterium]
MFKCLLFVLAFTTINAQQFTLRGKVTDKNSGEALSFANLRIAETSSGTAANIEGNYELKLSAGSFHLIASYIGYRSDTLKINFNGNQVSNFQLERIDIKLPEITVLPGENPALEIIRRAILFKQKRDEKINSYTFKAYTKGLVKTTKDISATDRSVGFSFGESDTAKLKITGIIENESRGYFKKPSNYKDEIIARKQSANTPSTINILTGGRIIQNFYTNDIQFFNRPLLCPIADDAIDYYDFFIEDTLAMDNKSIFEISFKTFDKSDPGFWGKIYIEDGSFAMVKLDVNLNDAANPGGIFSKVNIFQQFVPYDQNIFMPIDYRVFVEGNFLGLAKFGFELNSVFYDYQINNQLDDDFFDMVIVKVLPDADKKDSTYWDSMQKIPNTLQEVEAYNRIDSLESIPRNFWDDFSLLSFSTNISDNISISGPLSLYSFNKIEGHALNFFANVSNEFEKRFNGSINLSYGFSDKKFKSELSLRYLLGDYRTTSLSFNAYNKLADLFGESVHYNNLTSTLTSLIGKYDFRDYYYTKGWDFKIAGEVFPILRIGIGYLNRTDNTAFNNSDFSIFNKSKTYKVNKTIYDTKVNALTASFNLDFRKFIEDGYFRRRAYQGKGYAILSGEALFSSKSILKSNLDFNSYQLNLNGYIPTFKSATLNFALKGIYSTGSVPFQMLYALPGNMESSGKAYTFRTLSVCEAFGDRGAVLNVQHFFNDEIFKLLSIPFIEDLQLTLNSYLNVGWLKISDKSKTILTHEFEEFKKPLWEVGFGIGQILFPITLEFTWRLTHKYKNDFVIGINTFML